MLHSDRDQTDETSHLPLSMLISPIRRRYITAKKYTFKKVLEVFGSTPVRGLIYKEGRQIQIFNVFFFQPSTKERERGYTMENKKQVLQHDEAAITLAEIGKSIAALEERLIAHYKTSIGGIRKKVIDPDELSVLLDDPYISRELYFLSAIRNLGLLDTLRKYLEEQELIRTEEEEECRRTTRIQNIILTIFVWVGGSGLGFILGYLFNEGIPLAIHPSVVLTEILLTIFIWILPLQHIRYSEIEEDLDTNPFHIKFTSTMEEYETYAAELDLLLNTFYREDQAIDRSQYWNFPITTVEVANFYGSLLTNPTIVEYIDNPKCIQDGSIVDPFYFDILDSIYFMYRADQAIGEEPVVKTQKTGARIIQLHIPTKRDADEEVGEEVEETEEGSEDPKDE